MKQPKQPNLNALIGLMEKNVPIFKELAPVVEGEPLMGIRQYPLTMHDSEWAALLEWLKDAKRMQFIARYWHSTFEGKPLHVWLEQNLLMKGGFVAALDYVMEKAAKVGNT